MGFSDSVLQKRSDLPALGPDLKRLERLGREGVVSYGPGHGTAAFLSPTWFCYQLIAKPGNNTAAVP